MDKWTRQGEEGQNLERSPRLKRPLSPFARLRPLLATWCPDKISQQSR